MLSRSDTSLDRAQSAAIAQILRGGGVFGAVAFSEFPSGASDAVSVEPGYADCLPNLDGSYWRDPAQALEVEIGK